MSSVANPQSPAPESVPPEPQCFVVRGYGEHLPAHVLMDPAEFDAALRICEEEIALIDAVIESDRIARPAALEGERPQFDLSVASVTPDEAALEVAHTRTVDLMEANPGMPKLLRRLSALLIRGASPSSPRAEAGEDGFPGPWPKISVVSVSFNQAQYLEASIRSILDQNYPNLEYIVVDGGSTDGSVDIIERYRNRCDTVIIEPDRGQSDALNKGFGRATGEIMNWLCSDDLLEPGSLFEIGNAYARHGADFIVGGCLRIGETRAEKHYLHRARLPIGETVRLSPLDILHFMRSWQASNYFFQPETFFSSRIWDASGAYIKEHLFYVMDYDLWLRMALAGATAHHIPATIGCSRIHAAQKTQADRKYLHQMRQLMEEYQDMFAALKSSAA